MEVNLIFKPPDAVLEEAHRSAAALHRVVSSKKNPVIFKGEQYLEFEDWQTVAKFYGLCVRTQDAFPVEIFGVRGAKARAEVIDLRTGQVVGGAEAYCMRDEENWKEKPWFQLASMAQTRAGAKAFRNLLAWVVELAGYRGTPAEELPTPDESHNKNAELPIPEKPSREEVVAFLHLALAKGYATIDKDGKRTVDYHALGNFLEHSGLPRMVRVLTRSQIQQATALLQNGDENASP